MSRDGVQRLLARLGIPRVGAAADGAGRGIGSARGRLTGLVARRGLQVGREIDDELAVHDEIVG